MYIITYIENCELPKERKNEAKQKAMACSFNGNGWMLQFVYVYTYRPEV